jgi:hypothetical protein
MNAQEAMTSKKRTYEPRIFEWRVMLPEEQEQIYMQLLTSKSLEVSDSMRKLILEEWPELAHKLASKRPPG